MGNAAEVQAWITGVSAFLGAVVGVGGAMALLGYWLATRFNNVYARITQAETRVTTKIDEHEKLDIERFGKQDLAIMRLELVMQGKGKGLHQI